MATYIKGVTDVIPKLSPVNIDYKLLSTSLAALQNRYDRGVEQFRSMYNSLINKELSSVDNIELRREYLKKADAAISQLAGVDLANPTNVNQALSLFNPLTEDRQFMTDLYKTADQNAQMAKAESVRLSTDEKVRSQYSNIMQQYLAIGKQRLTEMRRDDGSIDAAKVHKFTPWQDPVEYASAIAEKEGLEIKWDYRDGLRKVTRVNGKGTEEIYETWFKNTIGNKFDEQFRIEAEVDLENSARSMMAKDPSLTRQAAMQQIAQDYSGRYVSLYNNQLNAIETKLNEMDVEKRKLEKKYPNKMPPNVYNQLVQMKELKDNLTTELDVLKREKGDDATFQQRSIEIFLNNPSGAFVPEVKNRYIERFGIKQSTGKQSTTYEADQVALQTYLQNDAQAHAYGMMIKQDELSRARKLEEMAIDFQYKVALKQIDKAGESGVSVGQMQDVGTMNPATMFRNQYIENFNTGSKAYLDTKVLSVAAGFKIEKGGLIQIPKGINIDMGIVTGAISNLSSSRAMTNEQKTQLATYLNQVSPGLGNQIGTLTFPKLQQILTKKVGQNAGLYSESGMGQVAYQSIYESNNARQAYANMWQNLTNNLIQLKNNSKYSPYIIKLANGGYTIDYNKVEKLSGTDKELTYKALMGAYYDQYKQTAAVQRQTIILNPADPNKFDYNILRQAVINAEKTGVTVGGQFTQFEDDHTKKLRDILLGGQNIKSTLDPSGTEYKRQIINNVEYVKVTIPVIKGTDGKSKATTLGIDPDGAVANNNKIEFLVPLNKAMNLAGPDPIVTDPITGRRITTQNFLTPLIQELAGTGFTQSPTSWVSEGLLGPNERAAFPNYLTTMIDNGIIGRDGNKIYARMTDANGFVSHDDITDRFGITYSDFKNDPGKYDKKILQYLEGLARDYDQSRLTHQTNAVNNNKTKAATSTDWVPWSQLSW